MTNHHAKHKRHHESSTQKEARLDPLRHEASSNSARQAGFLSFNFKKFMSKRDKFLIIGISLGVVALFAGSTYLILGGRNVDTTDDSEMEKALVAQEKINKEFDEMLAEVKDTTVIVNPRTIIPNSVTIKTGGSVGFFNETPEPVTIQAYDGASEILNIGSVAPFDIPVVVFEKAGTYRYINPLNPQDVAEIVVEE